MRMTEFYPALEAATEKLGLRWHEDERGYLRAPHKNDWRKRYCPITAVCEVQTAVYYDGPLYQQAAKSLGITDRHALSIRRAADLQLYGVLRRTKLKRAMGLAK